MVYLFLANGFEEIEALAPLDVLRRAGVPVTTVGVGGDSILGAHGIRVQADIPDTMYRDSAPDMIILPGGMPGSENLDHSRVVDAALRAGAKNGAYLCAICAAPMVLGKRGYLQGKRAVCYPGFEEYLDGARVTDARVECDGKVITSKGMGAALEFGLALVEVLCGKEKAEQISGAVFAK
ncbi:MAG: DJ-1/PfpI family protein [Clostridia bacterium]|jgi:4-methyl-5(b-hydroxyethyl)-thiazole monophosphate biosynthesis|nr:DJ-1/PfpI family protein [Clostridia bacterium]MBQ5792670.1 DJ-1/PfpI family protein [Clostridia bacterium]